MQNEFVKALSELTGEGYGSNLNENEQKDAAKRIKEIQKEREELRKTLETLDSENNNIEKELEKLEREVLTLRDNLRIQTEKAAEGIAVYGSIETLALAVKKMLGLQR